MAPTETLPDQGSRILPVATPLSDAQVNAHVHKTNRDTVITITVTIGVALVSLLLVFWCMRQRRALSNIFGAIRGRKNATEDVEAPRPKTLSSESLRRCCVPNFSNPSSGPARAHDRLLPPLAELPKTTDDLKKLGRETREEWRERDDSLDLGRPAGVGLRRVSISRSDETCTRGRSLTARPYSVASH